jgi:hypothetical protein
MNDDWERIWKETVVVYLKALSRHSPGGTEEKNTNITMGVFGKPGEI